MKTRLLHLLLLALLLGFHSPAPAAPASPSEKPAAPYLGWIPVQFMRPGDSLEIDMRRFFDPGEGGSLSVPLGQAGSYRVSYDAGNLRLKLEIDSEARGLLDIPVRLKAGNGEAPGVAVLTVAAQAPEDSADRPALYAEEITNGTAVFRYFGEKEPSVVSAVAQFPNGLSESLKPTIDGGRIMVPVAGLPDGSWIRVTAADPNGRVAAPVRVATGPEPDFRWQDGIIYYAFTDRFVNGSPDNDRPVENPDVLPQANYLGGDFRGIQQRIKDGYFKDLGVNVLWLAPLNRNPEGAWQEYLPPYRHYTGYHGYWPISATEVEPRFGGKEDLEALVGEAHAGGIKVIADLVLRHVHVENPLWREKKEWFGSLLLPDGRKNLRIWDEQQFTTWFEEWLPGFDFENPEAVAFLLGNAEYWAGTYDLNGFRLDAVKHIYPAFWWKFRSTMRAFEHGRDAGPMYYVGETFMDRRGIMQFVGPNMLDGQFDFPLYDTIIEVLARNQSGFETLEASLTESELIYGKETLMSPLVGNHDKSRFMAFADGDLPDPVIDDEEEVGWAKPPQVDDPLAYKRLKLALSFILAIDGVPMIYYGDEVGLTGAGDPDNRRMMPAEAELSAEQKAVREHLAAVAAVRHAHPALRYGSRRLLRAEGDHYAFVRRHLDDVVLAAWNKGGEPASFEVLVNPEMADGTYRDALSGNALTVEDGRATFRLEPRSSAFFVRADTKAAP